MIIHTSVWEIHFYVKYTASMSTEQISARKIVGCFGISIVLAILVCCLFYGAFSWYWSMAWSATPQEREKWATEDVEKAIQSAREDGVLGLYTPWFFAADETFYTTKRFQMLRNLQGIRSLYVCGFLNSYVPTDSVAAIASMSDLEEVFFQNTFFENGALIELSRLPKLKILSFWGCRFDAASLESFAEHGELRTLKIRWPFPNASENRETHQLPPTEHQEMLEALVTLKHLEKLSLQDSFRGDEEFLKQHLPNTNIEFENFGLDIP